MQAASNVSDPMSLEIEPLAPFGAVLRGVEIKGPLGDADLRSLKSYISQHGVVVLRGQASPSDAEFEGFMQSFGSTALPAVQGKHSRNSAAAVATAGRTQDVVILSNNVTEDGKPLGHQVHTEGLGWHTDY